jgi:hypothetical protein
MAEKCSACSGSGRITCPRCKGLRRAQVPNPKYYGFVDVLGPRSRKLLRDAYVSGPCPDCREQNAGKRAGSFWVGSRSRGWVVCPKCRGTGESQS